MGQILVWNAPQIIAKSARALERGMERGMEFLEGQVKRSISKGQPVKRSGTRLIGLSPSAPGEPPHVLTGRLRQSITHSVTVTATEVIGKVGTNVKYARRLELGFVGTDSRGRVIHQPERPYLRPGLRNNPRRILGLISKG